MLMTLGIRTIRYSGTTKEVFDGAARKTVVARNKIAVKDKRSFYSQIGFLQAHKQPQAEWLTGNDPSLIPLSFQTKYVDALLRSDLPRQHKSDLYSYTGNDPQAMSLSRLSRLCYMAGIELPSWVSDFHFDAVDHVIDHARSVNMFDVTMSDDSHEFVANGMVVHNSDNEWKLTAARDVGLRPLLSDIQDFLNTHILPFVDPELAKTHQIVLTGLDKDSPEKENTRLQQDMAVHMNYNEVMEQVEKNPIPVELGGDFPLNPQYQAVADKYLTVGQILENFFKVKGASADPRYQYIRDPFWFQNKQLILQEAQIAMQQSMQAQQMMQQQALAEQGIQTDKDGNPVSGEDEEGNPQQGDSGGDDGGGDSGGGDQPPEQTSKAEKAVDIAKDISAKNMTWAANNYVVLEKSIRNNHNRISRQLLKRHNELVNTTMSKWKRESAKELAAIGKALKDGKKKGS